MNDDNYLASLLVC